MSEPCILIVDDMPDNIFFLRDLLENSGYRVLTAKNGREALDIVEREPVDLVILDVMMPGIDGLRVLHEIRQTHDIGELPVILLSALNDNKTIARGFDLLANDYLTKPINLYTVKPRVRNLLLMKQLADERKEMLFALQQANDMKDRLMHIASHDLKNPLNKLRFVHDMLKGSVEDSPNDSEMLVMAERITDEMQAMISEFLDMQILQHTEIEIRLEPIPLQRLVLEVVLDYEHVAGRKDISIQNNIADVTVIADEKRLRQVLSNLISNALKYSPHGGTVYLSTERRGNLVALHVVDEGVGIPFDEVHKLFQPFGKLSTLPTAGESSTGLGLWIVEQMMQAQGGEVGLNEEYREGADFWIVLPMAPDADATDG